MPVFAKPLELLLPNGTIGLLLAERDVVAGTYGEVSDSEYVRIAHAAWDNGDGRVVRRNNERRRANLERLHQLSTTQVEARESWGLAGSQCQGEFVK